MLRPQDVEEGEIDKGLAGSVDTQAVKTKADETREDAKQTVTGLFANVKQALGLGGDTEEDKRATSTETKSTAHYESSKSSNTGGRDDSKQEVCFEASHFVKNC
jgi:hypothetical protein